MVSVIWVDGRRKSVITWCTGDPSYSDIETILGIPRN
jgi:hypothetical protein